MRLSVASFCGLVLFILVVSCWLLLLVSFLLLLIRLVLLLIALFLVLLLLVSTSLLFMWFLIVRSLVAGLFSRVGRW